VRHCDACGLLKTWFANNQRSADMFRHLLYPFLVYRDIALPFLVLSAIAVPCWLVFRVLRLRATGQRLSLRGEILLLTFIVYLSGVAAATLVPNQSSRYRPESTAGIDVHPNVASLTCSSATLPSGSTARSFCVRNARGNVLLFFPLGILIPLIWPRLRFRSGILIAIAVSCSIEVVQYLSRPWSNRLADVNDVILNVFGACVGLALVFLLRLLRGVRTGIPGV
jgi:glycopeptide antibiotics resistance protein